MTLNGWHIGERLIHKKLGHEDDYSIMSLFRDIDGDLPGEHAIFHSTRLPFIPTTTLDASGRPWGSILAGSEGKPGFIRNSRYSVLSMDAKLWPGEPMYENAKLKHKDGRGLDGEQHNGSIMLVAGIGIEFPTRRRNKFAGKVTRLEIHGDALSLDLFVDEAIGNCPKYINVRDLIPHPNTQPTVLHDRRTLEPNERLPDQLINFVTDADTVFFGTTYSAPSDEAQRRPSHLGMNQRGGRQGFVRVIPSDGRTVVLPDYSGNRFLTSLGNIEATPLASMTFVSFTTGDILYLTGEAKNLFNRDAQHLMPFQNALTTLHVTGYIYVSNALPVRQKPNTSPERSPYSPPIRLLAEESNLVVFNNDDSSRVTALLTSITLHDPSIATFTWETSVPLSIVPGQAVIMDFTSLVGGKKYQHLAPLKPTSVNDDRIRTWTISSSSTVGQSKTSFSVTMRERPAGLVTGGALFNIARKLATMKPELLVDSRPLSLTVGVLGITGDFVLPAVPALSPPPPPQQQVTSVGDADSSLPSSCTIAVHPNLNPNLVTRLLWIAGGIGVTPFLAMLKGLQAAITTTTMTYDIHLMLSTREPQILLPLIAGTLLDSKSEKTLRLRLVIDVFSGTGKEVMPDVDMDINNVVLRKCASRITRKAFEGAGGDSQGVGNGVGVGMGARQRQVYICGPEPFEKAVLAILEEFGIEKGSVKRESFTY